VGGNGSGKSTLLKLLTGLYQQTEGYIELDHQKITSANLADFRQLFASVFSDFCLFNKLHGLEHIEPNQMNELLHKVELRHKTGYQNGQFTHTDLSTGQRKRLAFISAWLEDKAIYIFDELAADQAPQFRQRFYEVILPELKSLGKTIVAVTHDDKYFHVADRVLKMDTGQLSEYSL
jgi:putative ATP-binding cassette transporter